MTALRLITDLKAANSLRILSNSSTYVSEFGFIKYDQDLFGAVRICDFSHISGVLSGRNLPLNQFILWRPFCPFRSISPLFLLSSVQLINKKRQQWSHQNLNVFFRSRFKMFSRVKPSQHQANCCRNDLMMCQEEQTKSSQTHSYLN